LENLKAHIHEQDHTTLKPWQKDKLIRKKQIFQSIKGKYSYVGKKYGSPIVQAALVECLEYLHLELQRLYNCGCSLHKADWYS